jgi:hypothetical protein
MGLPPYRPIAIPGRTASPQAQTLPSTANARMMRKKWERRRPGDPILRIDLQKTPDLLCTRSRQGGHRGAAASWNGSGTPRGHACRMVSAAPDCRTSCAVTCIRTASLPPAVSVSGKRDFEAREKSRQRPPHEGPNVSRGHAVASTPPIRAYSRVSRKSLQTLSCVVGPGGLPQSNKFNGLSRPTTAERHVDFQGVFSRLSYRLGVSDWVCAE